MLLNSVKMKLLSKLWWVISFLVISVGSDDTDCHYCCQCIQSIANCRSCNYNELPQFSNIFIEEVDMSFNKFKNTPYKNSKHIKRLNLSHNEINTFSSLYISRMEEIEVLDVSFNHISKTEGRTKLKKLTYLDMSHNPFRNFPTILSDSLTTLILINCSLNFLNTDAINTITSLEKLYLNGNPIKNITLTGFNLKRLNFVDLSECNLNSISQTVFENLPTLETLNLNKNKDLKSLAISSKSLKYLDVSESSLTVLPSGNLPALLEIKLQFNSISYLTDNFKYFPKLEKVDLSHNRINAIDRKAFNNLQNLKELDLSYNEIETIDYLSLNNNLEKLTIHHNLINNFNLNSSSLRILEINNCRIFKLETNSLIDLPRLSHLNLTKNNITYIADDLSSELLITLDVSFCGLKYLSSRTFRNLHSLRNLNLRGNKLTAIDPSFFPQISYVDLEDNPWLCDCNQLKSMFEWLNRTDSRLAGQLICVAKEGKTETWKTACIEEWYPFLYQKDPLWLYSVVIVIVMFILLLSFFVYRKIVKIRELQERTRDEQRQAEERESLRRMHQAQLQAREEENRNAPDPRELQRPPSYSEAVLLPPLDASHPSLCGSMHSFGSRPSLRGSNPDISKKGRTRRKRRRRKSESSDGGQRASRIIIDSETSDPDCVPQRREALESDF